MIDPESACAIAFQKTENLTPLKVMAWGHRKLLKHDLNGDAALDTAGTAKEGVLQRLEVPKRDNGCISWGQTSQPYEAQGCKMACCKLTNSCTEFAHCS